MNHRTKTPAADRLRLDPEVPFESWLAGQPPAYETIGLTLWSQSQTQPWVVSKENRSQADNWLSGVWQRLARQSL